MAAAGVPAFGRTDVLYFRHRADKFLFQNYFGAKEIRETRTPSHRGSTELLRTVVHRTGGDRRRSCYGGHAVERATQRRNCFGELPQLLLSGLGKIHISNWC